MDKFEIIKNALVKEKQGLSIALNSAKKARDEAPSAMESHSDTSRAQNEKLVDALEQQLKEVETATEKLILVPDKFRYLEISLGGETKKFILVPEGLGGKEVGDIRLLSDNTPLGGVLKDKQMGDKFEFNNQQIEVLQLD